MNVILRDEVSPGECHPRLHDELGPRGEVQREHAGVRLPDLRADQPQPVDVEDVLFGVVVLVDGPQLVRVARQRVVAHHLRLTHSPLRQSRQPDAAGRAAAEVGPDADGLQAPLRSPPTRLVAQHAPLAAGRLGPQRVAPHPQTGRRRARVRTDHPVAAQQGVRLVVQILVVVLVLVDRPAVDVPARQPRVHPVTVHLEGVRLVDAADEDAFTRLHVVIGVCGTKQRSHNDWSA